MTEECKFGTLWLRIRSTVVATLHCMTACFPFVMATVLSALVFFGGAGQFVGHDLAYYGLENLRGHALSGGGLFAFLAGFLVLQYVAARRFCNSPRKWAFALAVVALLVRLALVCLFWKDLAPSNDNGFAWLRAIGEPSAKDYHATIPCWMNYSLFLRLLAALFGKSYGVDLVTCALFDAVAVFLLFLVAVRMTGNVAVSLLAAAFLAFNPALVAYATVGTPEHVSIALFLAGSYLFCRMTESESLRVRFAFAAFCGIVLGCADSIKPISPLVGTALLMAVALGGRFGEAQRRVRVLVGAGTLAVLFITHLAVVRGVTAATEGTFGVRLSDKQSITHMLVVGLNRQGEGQIGMGGLSRTVQDCLKSGMSMEEAGRIGRERVLADWRGHYDEVPILFVKKFIWAWQDFSRPHRYFGKNHKSFVKKNAGKERGAACKLRRFAYWAFTAPMAVANSILYFCVMLCGACAVFRRAFDGRRKSPLEVFACLFILGFFMMLAVIEAQSRYKCLIMPFVFVYAAEGASRLFARRRPTMEGASGEAAR